PSELRSKPQQSQRDTTKPSGTQHSGNLASPLRRTPVMGDFATFYANGGVFMHTIALCAVLGLAVTVERFIFLFFRFNINGQQFFNQIQKLVMANNIDRAIKLCNAADKAALARVVKAGLTRANKSEADISAAIEESMLEVGPAINKRVSTIPAIG